MFAQGRFSILAQFIKCLNCNETLYKGRFAEWFFRNIADQASAFMHEVSEYGVLKFLDVRCS
ncbi:hypothetical protein AS889_24105 [Pseudomonas putida]|nr:hypothetical protein AS889_24105 [Pseudomonas putida]ORL51299.1 hypothetical protein B7H18_13455 [Pseudomonas putida]